MPRLLVLSDDHWTEANGDSLIARFPNAVSPESFRAEPPAAIVFDQPLPGDVPRERVERWRAAYPFARLVVLLGPWCEGETRTGVPLPGVERVRWSDWESWLSRTLMTLDEHPPEPPTLSLAERIERASPPVATLAFSVFVSAIRPDNAAALIEAAIALGGRLVDQSDAATAVDWLFWDGDPNDPADVQRLHTATARWLPRRIAAFVNFPRPGELEAIVERIPALAGAVLVAKPFLLADLATVIGQSPSATAAK